MDLSQLPEKERREILAVLDEKQAKQFMDLFGFVINTCFSRCVSGFTEKKLTGKESECTRRCMEKILKLTNRIGHRMAEKDRNTHHHK